MACSSLKLIAIVADSQMEMGGITPLVCVGQGVGSNRYYLGRVGSLAIQGSTNSDCEGFCGSSSSGGGNSSSFEYISPIIGPRGGIFMNYVKKERWNSSANSTGASTSWGSLSDCDCKIKTTFSQKVEDFAELRWRENEEFPDGMEPTFPKDSNKLTCEKRYFAESCEGVGGYTYPGPEPEEDCLSDAFQTFSSCGFCSGGGEGDAEINESGGCASSSYKNKCVQIKGEELTEKYLFSLVEKSSSKTMAYLSGLPDSLPNESGTGLVLNSAKWSPIADCAGSVAFSHKETPEYYGARKTILKLRIIDPDLFSEDLEAQNRALKNNSSGEIKFIDISDNSVVLTISFGLSGGKADLQSISNTDEEFAPASPGEGRTFSVSIIITSPPCEGCG